MATLPSFCLRGAREYVLDRARLEEQGSGFGIRYVVFIKGSMRHRQRHHLFTCPLAMTIVTIRGHLGEHAISETCTCCFTSTDLIQSVSTTFHGLICFDLLFLPFRTGMRDSGVK